ncbi:MAG: lipopolysaccharide/colanic/teichoic acid biosynthesis glycosyltransferase [Polaribacter sp.]|jgi:lipopolysaccharide/colanic/teichoic acid biosynthesis glycosyltransferase
MFYKIIKRGIDICVSLIALIVFSPIIITVSLILAAHYHGKTPFFFQKRPGKNEKIFKIIKFKTMTDAKDTNGNLLTDDKRLTPTGKFIRKTSLDEIPQLINVLMGTMSIIGPRPLLPQYLELYNKEQKKRHLVRPGITGWAQVNGRNSISWKHKFELDVFYVEHMSFPLDIKILLKTIKKVIKVEDINATGHATSEAFNGKN